MARRSPAVISLARGFLLLGLICIGQPAISSEIYVSEATRFIDLQRDNYNSMLTGQNRLKRACSAPVLPSGAQRNQLPDLTPLKAELNAEAQRFVSRARANYNAAKREESIQCRNPIGKVLELFGTKSACSEAAGRTRVTQTIFKSASDWQSLLKLQLKVLDDAKSLETRACLSSGFTSKLTDAYVESVRPQESTLSTLFNRWTSAQ